MELPKFVEYNNNKFLWNEENLTFSPDIYDDHYFLKNLFSGSIVRGDCYPLIFTTGKGLNKYRSLKFYKEVAENIDIYLSLSDKNKLLFQVGLRDLFFAVDRDLLTNDEKVIFQNVVSMIDDNSFIQIDGINMSYYPSSNYKLVKFISSDVLEEWDRHRFIMPSLEHMAVFINPEELSYHNFENILQIDSMFRGIGKINFSTPRKIDKLDAFTFNVQSDNLNEIIDRIDKLNMYVSPLNKNSRGGKRLIFKSSLLGEKITECVDKWKMKGFKRINDIFRLNKFKPSDNKFQTHLDTPYYDKNNNEVSLYTILLYISGGKSSNENPILKIENHEIHSIESMTGFIFHQKYEHEGNTFDTNTKLFIRSELIFSCPKFYENPIIGDTFAKACYLTKESIFHPELQQHASDHYNKVAEMHWGLQGDFVNNILLLKNFNGIVFITNGCDYWFGGGNIQYNAFIVILDYFNIESFNSQCRSIVLPNSLRDSFLSTKSMLNVIQQVNSNSYEDIFKKNFDDLENIENNSCCLSHMGDEFDPKNNSSIRSVYYGYMEEIDKIIKMSTFFVFGKDVFVDPNNALIDNNKIFFRSKGEFPRINFASCWNFEENYEDFILKGEDGVVYNASLPPVIFYEFEDGVHYKLDGFKNNFQIVENKTTIPIIGDPIEGTQYMYSDEDDYRLTDGSSGEEINDEEEVEEFKGTSVVNYFI